MSRTATLSTANRIASRRPDPLQYPLALGKGRPDPSDVFHHEDVVVNVENPSGREFLEPLPRIFRLCTELQRRLP